MAMIVAVYVVAADAEVGIEVAGHCFKTRIARRARPPRNQSRLVR
jgi:hypothetical protein